MEKDFAGNQERVRDERMMQGQSWKKILPEIRRG